VLPVTSKLSLLDIHATFLLHSNPVSISMSIGNFNTNRWTFQGSI
jgi:hypothetical protein